MYKKILIIDDSDIDRFLTEAIIRINLFAESTVSVRSASEGLTYLRSLETTPERLPAIIFLDINMPDMSGFDFLDSFMQFPKNMQGHCAIFMISATKAKEELNRIKTYPVVRNFFEKPLTLNGLNTIAACMTR